YDPSVPAERVDPFQRGADAKVMWELGRLPQLWRFGQAFRLTSDPSWARAWEKTVRQFQEANARGMGVQWACAMEVSLRAMTVALGGDLPRRSAGGARRRSGGPAARGASGARVVPQPGIDAEALRRDAADRRPRLLPRAAARAAQRVGRVVLLRPRCAGVDVDSRGSLVP